MMTVIMMATFSNSRINISAVQHTFASKIIKKNAELLKWRVLILPAPVWNTNHSRFYINTVS